MNMQMTLGELGPVPGGHVRLLIQDYAGTPNPGELRVKNIPVPAFYIGAEDGSRWRRWLKKLRRKFGEWGFMAVVGTILLAKSLSQQHGLGEQHLPLVIGAITSAICTSFKVEQWTATHNFTTGQHAVKVALYTSSATLGAGTTAYSATNEIAGTGYSAGGVTIANVTPTSSGTTSIADWADAQWTTASFTANGCLMYNSTASNKAILVIAFGSDQTVTSGTFTIQWPTADASNAILRAA
jgi:hypothetical protein